MFHYILLLDYGGTWHFIELLTKNNSEKKAAFVDLSQLFHYDRIRIQISMGKQKHIFPSHFSPCALAPYLVITFYNNASTALYSFLKCIAQRGTASHCKLGSFAYSYMRFPKPCCTVTHLIIAVCESSAPTHPLVVFFFSLTCDGEGCRVAIPRPIMNCIQDCKGKIHDWVSQLSTNVITL